MGKFRFFGAAVLTIAMSVPVWGQTFNTNGNSSQNHGSRTYPGPAIIEVYLFGGGGGGQGGHGHITSNSNGRGGGGGGGAALYAKFEIQNDITISDITAGAGAGGGGCNYQGNPFGDWNAGDRGSGGSSSSVTISGTTISAGGGSGAPRTNRTDLTGGGGGGVSHSSWPNIAGATRIEYEPRDGNRGNTGNRTSSSGGEGGSAVSIHGVSGVAGGRGGNSCGISLQDPLFGSQNGARGGNGYVRIIATNLHKITYNLNGGSGTTPEPQTVIAGSNLALSNGAGITRPGYRLIGWSTNTSGTGTNHPLGASYITTQGNVTWFARWEPISHSITYFLDGGTNNSANPVFYTILNTTITLQPPSKDGYRFGGWYGSSSFTENPVTSFPGSSIRDTAFYAKWELIPNPILFNGVFNENDVKVRLSWRYSGLNVAGKFYVYRRQTEPTPVSAWALLNPSGIDITNGYNVDLMYDDATVSFSRTYDYHVVFVEGSTAPSATVPPTDNSANVSVSTNPEDGEIIPSPISLVGSFNQRSERAGANGQVILDWRYHNPHQKDGKFYIYRRETSPLPSNWSLRNSSGIDVITSANILSMAYADNSITPQKTYEYRIVFVEGVVPPFATTPPTDNGANISVNTELQDGVPGSNAYTPFNRNSDEYVVDGVTYRDIYGIGQRDLRNRDHEVFRRLLNGFQLSGSETHLSRWMDLGKLIAPLNSDVANLLTGARNMLNTRRTSRPAATNAMLTGALNAGTNIAGAASAMLAEFNMRNGYAIDDTYVPVDLVPPALSALDEITTPVFWVLDRYLVHSNDVIDDRSAGNADYSYYGVGLIFHDLKLSYLETGDPFHSAVSGITGIINEPVAGFRYNFGGIEEPMVSGVRNLSGVTGSYTQTWTDHSEFTIGNEVSILNGYEISEMRGTGTSMSVSFNVGKSSSHTAGGEVSFGKGFVAGGKGKYEYTWGTSESTTHEEINSVTFEFTTSEIFQHTNSRFFSETIGNSMEYSVEVSLPPHTQVMLKQGRSNIEAHIDYDYPATMSYKVTVVALGSQNIGGTSTVFMRPIATYGIDKTPANRASSLEIDAAENFRVLWGFRNDRVNTTFHSADTISLSRIWSQMKQVTGGVSNFTLLSLEDDADDALEANFINPVAVGMTKERPMTIVRGTMSHEFKSMNSEIYEFQPIYALHRIEAIGLDAIDLLNGSQYFVDRIELTGRNIHGVDFYGFHRDKGSWALTNANGSLHDGSIATLMEEVGTGRPIVGANDNNIVGTVFLRYLINSDVYSYDGLNGYMTPNDLGTRTAIIPVNVRSTGALGIAAQPQGGTMTVAEAVYPLSVEVVAVGNISYQWFINTEPSNVGGLPIPGATDPTFNAPLGTIGVFYYYVVVSIDDLEVEPVVSMLAILAVEDGQASVNTTDRIIPPDDIVEEAVVAPIRPLTAQFTAGPNPVSRRAGVVNFYRQGKRFESGTLTIFDATGNIVNRLSVNDRAFGDQSQRVVGSWNLTDRRGRQVSEGMYLVRGTITVDGKKERVSLMVGVR
jgi:uncharacterized repeat protein (TIGR02543 family)